MPGAAKNQGGTAGRPVHRHLRMPPGLWNRRHRHVPAGDRRVAGGLDAEEVRGRPGGEPVPPCGPGVAENRGRGGAGSHRPGKARRPGAGSGRRRHPPGRRGGGGGGHRQPGLPHRRVRPRGQAFRRRSLRRHCGGGGRVHPGGEAGHRPGPLRPDRGDDSALRADEVRRRGQGVQSGGQAGALHLCREPAEPGPHPERDPGPVGAHGGLLLRPEAGHAPGGALRHAGGGTGAHHCQGR